MTNTEFSFLYRDAANYKTFGSVVYTNSENTPLAHIRKTILASCNPGGNFDPRHWAIPNIRTQPYNPEPVHDWFEFEMVEETEEIPTDGRNIGDF